MLPPSSNTWPWKLHMSLMHSSNTISWSHAEHHWGYSNQFLKLRFADFQTALHPCCQQKRDGEERLPRSENQVGDS
ncbi:hypothetical protein BDL97_03G059100 [Sphagnum fallax]|nr:hypothetical protein BDL97_03G059100 [Sphagnum fallax]